MLSSPSNSNSTQTNCPSPKEIHYHVEKVIPREPAFTEGLVFYQGKLYESSGEYGKSKIQTIDPQTGAISFLGGLPSNQFGEGLALVENGFVQLTWKENVAHFWDFSKGTSLSTIKYNREGWGLVGNPKDHTLIASDGTSTLYLLDSKTLNTITKIKVVQENQELNMLNELEYVKHNQKTYLWANVWLSDRIVEINPETGCVTGKMDVSELKNYLVSKDILKDKDSVFNGIAYDEEHDLIYLTAKNWPIFFAIKTVD